MNRKATNPGFFFLIDLWPVDDYGYTPSPPGYVLPEGIDEDPFNPGLGR
jgi:hypothetical protein